MVLPIKDCELYRHFELTQTQAESLMQGIQCPIHFVLGSRGFNKVNDLIAQRKALFKDAKLTVT